MHRYSWINFIYFGPAKSMMLFKIEHVLWFSNPFSISRVNGTSSHPKWKQPLIQTNCYWQILLYNTRSNEISNSNSIWIFDIQADGFVVFICNFVIRINGTKSLRSFFLFEYYYFNETHAICSSEVYICWYIQADMVAVYGVNAQLTIV